jgi:hypothetical protein
MRPNNRDMEVRDSMNILCWVYGFTFSDNWNSIVQKKKKTNLAELFHIQQCIIEFEGLSESEEICGVDAAAITDTELKVTIEEVG